MSEYPTWAYRFRDHHHGENDMDYCDNHEGFAAGQVPDPDVDVTIVWWEFD